MEIIVDSEFEGVRLDKFLKNKLQGLVQSEIEKAIRKKDIKINGKKEKANYRLKEGDIIYLYDHFGPSRQDTKTKSNDLIVFDEKIIRKIKDSILYLDENILILNKPRGLAVQAGSKIIHSIDRYVAHIFKNEDTKLVHRLDKDTSGVMIIAMNHKASTEIAAIIKAKEMKKKYICLVKGAVAKKEGTINLNLSKGYKVEAGSEGKESITHFKVLCQNKEVSLLEMTPITGRKHQIRVSCVELGHPIIGDGKYGGAGCFHKLLSKYMHLHAYSLEIDNLFGKKLIFSAPLPEHMQKSLNVFGFKI